MGSMSEYRRLSGIKNESTKLEQMTITLKGYCDKILSIVYDTGNAVSAPMEFYGAAADLVGEIGRMIGKGAGDKEIMTDLAEVYAKLQKRSEAHRETNNWTENP